MKITFIISVLFVSHSLFSIEINAAGQEQTLSESSYQIINESQQLMTNDQPRDAIKILKILLKQIQDKPYDLAVTYQMLGHAYYQTNDTKNARQAFINAAEINKLPKNIQHELELNIARLLAFDESYKEALKYLEKWLEYEPDPNADAHLLAATIFYHLNDYNKMIPHLNNAISKTNKVPMNWYELLASAYIQTKQYSNAANIFEKLVRLEPTKKQNWMQLMAAYQLAKQDKRSLAINELAYKKGFLDKQQIISLANTYLYLDIPIKAAMLLEKEIQKGKLTTSKSNLELLANSWMLAHEKTKAISALEKITETDRDPELFFRLGQLYYESSQWEKAIEHLSQVISHDNKEQTAQALLLTGIAFYELNDQELSRDSFTKALSYKKTREHARWWLQQLKDKNKITQDS